MGAGGLDTFNMGVLKDIARLAYGSGMFNEKDQGGNGFLGAVIGKDGKPRIFKMLTHEYKGEQAGLGKTAESMNAFLSSGTNGKLAEYSDGVKDLLLKLAQKAGLGDRISKLFEQDGKPLLSRKIVAAAVTTIMNEGKIQNDYDKFTWDEVGRNRARTVKDTSVEAVVRDAEAIKTGGDTEHTVTDIVGARGGVTVDDNFLTTDPLSAKTIEDMIANIKDGKFDRGWLTAVSAAEGLCDNIFYGIGNDAASALSGAEKDSIIRASNDGFAPEDNPDKLFLDTFKLELVKSIEKFGKMPTDADKPRIIKHAYLKASICAYVYNVGKTMIDKLGNNKAGFADRRDRMLEMLAKRTRGEAVDENDYKINPPIEQTLLNFKSSEEQDRNGVNILNFALYDGALEFSEAVSSDDEVGYPGTQPEVPDEQEQVDEKKTDKTQSAENPEDKKQVGKEKTDEEKSAPKTGDYAELLLYVADTRSRHTGAFKQTLANFMTEVLNYSTRFLTQAASTGGVRMATDRAFEAAIQDCRFTATWDYHQFDS